jgi:hypothetical protein
MSDRRPSDDTGDRMFTAAAEYGRTYWGWDQEPIPELGYETADAQHIVAAIDRLTEQTRVANMIAFGQTTGESYRTEIRKALGISHE